MAAETSATSWTLRGRFWQLTAGFAAVVVLLVVIIAVAATRFVGTGDDVIDRWQPARLAGAELQLDLVNEETGVRGYAITHRVSSLQPYRQFVPEQRANVARLTSLIGDDAQLRRLLDDVLERADEWRRFYVAPLLADRGRLPATVPSAADAGKALFDRVRLAGQPLDAALVQRVEDSEHDRDLTGVVAIVAIGFGILVVLGAGLIVRRGLDRWILGPVGSLGGQTRLVAQGRLERSIEASGPAELVELAADVEAMRAQLVDELSKAERITADLRRQGAELERSNGDLQQFAYVASHDLSEPLRKVSNFCQLLERQYGPQLDDRARQYIDFAVDGAKRMQALINDLLALSRVGRTTESFVPVECDHAMDQALSTLGDRIVAAGAVVERRTALPTVDGDRALLVSLFENLVGNAVKYRRDDVAPTVAIESRHGDDVALADGRGPGWTIRVSDNGIGIDPQYAERIFAVFQRLHLRDQYGGTGIGLALCRRIVEFHGGKIELDTADHGPDSDGSAVDGPDRGARFVVTLPEGKPRAAPQN